MFFLLFFIELILLVIFIYDDSFPLIFLILLNFIFFFIWSFYQYKNEKRKTIDIVSSIMRDVKQISIYVVDLELNYLAVSDSDVRFMEHFFKVTPVVGKNLSSILSKEHFFKTKETFKNALYNGLTNQVEHFNKNDIEFYVLNYYTPLYDKSGSPYALMIHTIDVTDDILEQDKIYHLIYIDPLTGVYNRRKLIEYVETELPLSDKNQILIYIDIDDFKQVNDNSGHLEGDKVLIRFTENLRKYFPEPNMICRLGGDEFCLLFEEIDGKGIQKCVWDRMQKVEEEMAPYEFSIGAIIMELPFKNNFDYYYQKVDRKMYEMKSRKKEKFSE